MFENLFTNTKAPAQSGNTQATVQPQAQATVLPKQNTVSPSSGGLFGNLFSNSSTPQVNPFAKQNEVLNAQAQPKQPQIITKPIAKSSGNFLQDAGNYLGNLFTNTANSPVVKGAESAAGNLYHSVVNGISGNTVHAITNFLPQQIKMPLYGLTQAPNVIDQLFKVTDKAVGGAQDMIQNAATNQQQGKAGASDNVVSAISTPLAWAQKNIIDPIGSSFVNSKPGSLGNLYATEIRGMQRGVVSQYLGDSQKVMDTFNTPLDKPVTVGQKTVSSVGELIGSVAAFIGGGEVLKGAQLGRATMPVLFAALGQTSSPSSLTALQRIEKAPVDAIAGWLFGTIKAPTGITSAITTTAKAGAVGATQQFINSVIEGLPAKDAARTALTMGMVTALFHVAGSATGLIGGKLLDSQIKQGVFEMSPQEVQHQVVHTDLQGTKAGETLMKMSLEAQAEGKNLRITASAAKQSKLAGVLNLETPNGISFSAELVDAPAQIQGAGQENAPVQPVAQEGQIVPEGEIAAPKNNGEIANDLSVKNESNPVKSEFSQSPEAPPLPHQNGSFDPSLEAKTEKTAFASESGGVGNKTPETIIKNTSESKQTDLNKLVSLKDEPSESVNNAKKYITDAMNGKGEPRAPIKTIELSNGQHVITDGNATYQALKEMGYTSVPTEHEDMSKLGDTKVTDDQIMQAAKEHYQAVGKMKEYGKLFNDLATEHGGEKVGKQDRANVKSIVGILEKRFKRNVEIKDTLRDTILVKHPQDVQKIVNSLREKGFTGEGFNSERRVNGLKNRYEDNQHGYKDANYQFTKDGQTVELQIMQKHMHEEKQLLGHHIYDLVDKAAKTEELTGEQKQAVEELRKYADDRYQAAFYRDNPDLAKEMSDSMTLGETGVEPGFSPEEMSLLKEQLYTLRLAESASLRSASENVSNRLGDVIDKSIPQISERSNSQNEETSNLIREALYSGDIEGAKTLHDSFSDSEGLPSFDSLQGEVNSLIENTKTELATIKKELVTSSMSHDPEDPTNQLLKIAQQLSDHFSRPGAKFKLTGTERTYKSEDGKSMVVGGNAVEAFDRLINATDIEGFSKNIRILHLKFNSVFTKMYDNIKSGAIDGADYDTFKNYYQDIQGQRFTGITKASKASSGQTDSKPIESAASGAALQRSTQPEESAALQSSNENDRTNEVAKPIPIETESTLTKPGSAKLAEDTGSGDEQRESGTTGNGNNVEIGEPQNHIDLQRGSVQLNATIDPGIGKFFSEEIKPVFHGASEVGKEWSNVINPPKASEAAARAANAIRKAEAHIANYRGITRSKYHSFEKFFDRYSDEQNVKNISTYERTGKFAVEPNMPEGEMPYSQLYNKSMQESYQVLLAAYGKDEASFIDNYVRRQFIFDSAEDEAKGTTYLTNYMRSLSADKSPLKKRVLDMPLDEALANMKERDIKVKMVSSNPEALRQWSLINAQRALAYKEAWNDAKVSKLIVFVPRGGELPKGFIKLNDRAAEIFAPAEVHYPISGTKPLEFQEKGYETTLQMGRYYADPGVARVFNNAISQGLESSPTYKAVRYVSNMLNQFQLGFSAFHLGAVGIDAGVTDLSIGLAHLIQGHPIDAAKHLGIGIVPFGSFTKDMYHGNQLLKALKNNSPEAYRFLEEKLNPAGGRLNLDEHYRNEAWKKIQSAVLNGNPIGAAVRTAIYIPPAVIQLVAKPLMEFAVPRVKIGAFMNLAELKLSRLPADASDFERRQALVSAWTSIDNRMGQLAYSNLFWNKVGKDIAMLSVRSVGWDLGTLRELGGGAIDALKLGGKEYDTTKIIGNKGITDRLMWSLALVMYAGLLGAIYQLLHTGEWPKELKDYLHPKNGLTDKNGNADRISLPTYLKDIYAYTHDPIQTSLNKASPLLSMISDLVTNSDYYGNLIRNPNDPIGTQLEQEGSYFLKAVLPFSLQQAANKGDGNLVQKVEGFFGMIKAPQAVIQSDQQKGLIKAFQEQRGLSAPKTPEQVQLDALKNKARDEITKNGWQNSPSFKALMQNGTLDTQLKRRNFIKTAGETGMQRMQKSLPKAVRRQFATP